MPTIDWTKQHTRHTGQTMLTDGPGLTCTALVKIEGGKFVLIGSPDVPYYAYDSSTMDWTEPTESDCRAG